MIKWPWAPFFRYIKANKNIYDYGDDISEYQLMILVLDKYKIFYEAEKWNLMSL